MKCSADIKTLVECNLGGSKLVDFFSFSFVSSLLFFFPTVRMAPHSITLAWKIPWMEEPGGLQSLVSLRVGED